MALWAPFLAGILGCGSKETPKPDLRDARPVEVPPLLMKVEGIITFNGKPLSGGLVMFLPANEKGGRPASGLVNAKGEFDLGTVNPGDGIVPGVYQVVVTQLGTGKEAKSPVIPDIYTNPEKTPLKCKVERDGQKVKLELQSK